MRTGNLNSDGFCKQPISNAAFCGTWWVGLNEKQMLLGVSIVLTGRAGPKIPSGGAGERRAGMV